MEQRNQKIFTFKKLKHLEKKTQTDESIINSWNNHHLMPSEEFFSYLFVDLKDK